MNSRTDSKLIKEAVPSVEKVRMVNSGTEACMSALRLARGFTKRDLIVKVEGGYHGHADYLLVRAGSGLDNLDTDYVAKHGIQLHRIEQPGARAVARRRRISWHEPCFGVVVASKADCNRCSHFGRRTYFKPLETPNCSLGAHSVPKI